MIHVLKNKTFFFLASWCC